MSLHAYRNVLFPLLLVLGLLTAGAVLAQNSSLPTTSPPEPMATPTPLPPEPFAPEFQAHVTIGSPDDPVSTTIHTWANTELVPPGAILSATVWVTYTTGVQPVSALIINPIPIHTTYITNSATASLPPSVVYDAQQNRLVWQGTLSPGQSVIIRYSLRVNCGVPNGTIITNRASVYFDGILKGYVDFPPLEVQAPNLTESSKTGPPKVTLGMPFDYAISLRNTGIITARGASLRESLPPGLTYVSGSASAGQISFAAGVFQWAGNVGPTQTVLITTTMLATTTGLITNTVIISDGVPCHATFPKETTTSVAPPTGVPKYNLQPPPETKPPTCCCAGCSPLSGIDIVAAEVCARCCTVGDYFGLPQDTCTRSSLGASVYLHSGEVYVCDVDLEIPGRGFNWQLARKYHSGITYNGLLGHNWQLNYNQYLVKVTAANLSDVYPGFGTIAPGDVLRIDGYGRVDIYPQMSDGSYQAPPGFYTRLTRRADGSFEERDYRGITVTYSPLDEQGVARMTTLSDRHGNTMSFQYNALGQLTQVLDTLSRPITYTYDSQGHLTNVQDFIGRVITFTYDAAGDLVAVTRPAVTGTPNGNDYPGGKTIRYTYSNGFANPVLNHNLTAITAPQEVATGGLPRIQVGYNNQDRVVAFTLGGTNASGVPAGGTVTYVYGTMMTSASANFNQPVTETEVVDRNGNRTVYQLNHLGNIVTVREYTNRNIRPGDPDFYETSYYYNVEGELVRQVYSEGNSVEYVYDETNTDRLQRGNLSAEIRRADPDRGGDQAMLTTTYTYEPIYNKVRTATEARGNAPAYVPPNGGAWSPARYTTIHTFDYEEGCNFAAIGARIGRTSSEVQQLLAQAGLCLAPLGDVNGDGLTNQINGNVIRTIHPTVTLLSGSNQALVEGDTAQEIVELYTYNQFSQRLSVRDPEGNVDVYEYYPERDPNGDGVIDNPAGNPLTGGYLKQVTRDAVSSASRNSGTNPTPTNIRHLYKYDSVGNVIREVDGRGIATDYVVNALNQVVQVTRAAAHNIFVPDPAEPLPLTAFQYLERTFYDANDNVVRHQVEDRGNTSNVGGDNAGSGTAFVDYVYVYDMLDQRVQMTEEVSDTLKLITRYRYDPNGNQVLVIQPEGNATASIYDERDLLFQTGRGVVAPPPNALLAASDPTDYDVRGGISCLCMTYHYDGNRNLIEAVDAADTDGSPANNSDRGGTGDRTRYIYDGFDRRTSVVDSVGNQTVYQYDPAGNVVRTARFGPVGGPSPTADGPDVLPMPVSSDGIIQAANLVNTNLLEATEYRHDELSRLFQMDRALFVNTIPTVRLPNVADGASDLGKGDLTPGDTCAVPGVPAPPCGYRGCVTTRTEYDRNSRPTFTVEDDGDTYRTFYDGADRVIKTVDPERNLVEVAYDDNGNVIETRETDVSQVPGVASEVFLTTNFYDSLNRLQRSVDNLGQTFDYRYDSRGNLVAMADALGPVTGASIARRAFASGTLTDNAINDFGNVTLYFYDGLSRKTREETILTASGQGDGVHIGATWEGIKTTTPTPALNQGGGDGIIRIGYNWDKNSLLSSLIDDQGNVTLYLYDNLNRRVAETKGLTVNTAPLNKIKILGLRQIVAPTVATINNPAVIPAAKLDTQLAAAKARLNAVASLFPPLADRVDDNPPTTIVYGYDEDDNLLILEDENDSEVFAKYDAINRRLAVRVFRAGQTDSHAGDPLFAPAPVSDPSNLSTVFPAVVGTTKQDFEYDGLSRLTRATDNNEPANTSDNSVITYAYDSLSRVLEERQQIGTLSARAVSSAWRAEGLRSMLTYPNGRVVNYTYDRLDRLKAIQPYRVYFPIIRKKFSSASSQPPAGSTAEYALAQDVSSANPISSQLLVAPIATYTYIGPQRVLERTYAPGVRLTFLNDAGTADVGYDGLRRPVQLRHLRSDDSLIVGFTHTYDRMNNKLTEGKLHDQTNNEAYNYDSAYRLIQFARPGGAIPPLHSQWTLDGVGNWRQVDSETRQHSSFNEIIARSKGGVTTILSDDNGNLTDDGTYKFTWDYSNRLRTVTRKSDSALIAVYTYDAAGRRIRKVVSNSGALNGSTDFYYDGWQELEERNAADALVQQHVYGLYIDEPLVLDRNLDDDGSATGPGDQRLFYHQNTLYSVFALTDSTGKIVEGYQYDAYGRQTVFGPGGNGVVDFGGDDVVMVGGASIVGNPYLFTGRRLDPETSLYYYRTRYLDPAAGRFITRDAIGIWSDPQNLGNAQAFVANNPTSRRDPLGTHAECPKCQNDMEELVVKSTFCRDRGIMNVRGSQCYREMTGAGNRSRHCCYRDGRLGGPWADHIDGHNPAKGKKPNGDCKYSRWWTFWHFILDSIPDYLFGDPSGWQKSFRQERKPSGSIPEPSMPTKPEITVKAKLDMGLARWSKEMTQAEIAVGYVWQATIGPYGGGYMLALEMGKALMRQKGVPIEVAEEWARNKLELYGPFGTGIDRRAIGTKDPITGMCH